MRFVMITVLLLILTGCSSSKLAQNKKCPKTHANGYSEIVFERYKTLLEQDTIIFNEARYQCAQTALYTKKVMYDKFGKWNQEIYPTNNSHPILLWENVELFSDGQKYNVFATGAETSTDIYSSVMVFDQNDRDLLSESSTQKTVLANYFGSLIKANNSRNEAFYEVYWTAVDPDQWKAIKANRSRLK